MLFKINTTLLNLVRTSSLLLSLATLFFFTVATAQAGQVTLAWDDPNSQSTVVGYKVYYRTATTTYATQAGNPVAVVPKSTNPEATITLPDGSYYFAVTAYNATTESGFSNEVGTTLGTSLVANFSANPISGPMPLRVTFTDQSSGSVSKWTWNFGDGSPLSNEVNPSHDYTAAGTFNAQLIVSDSLGNTSSPKTVAVKVTSSSIGSLPSPWLDNDIGSVGLPGSASYASNTFTVKGSGTDIWDTNDAFHFAYQTLNGDGTIVARVASMTNTNPYAKAGVMIRATLNANSANAMVKVTPSGINFHYRNATGEPTSNSTGYAANFAPYWIKLTRSGSTFTAYKSAGGSTWRQIGSAVTISMGTSVYVGLAVTSNNNTTLNTAIFDNVSIQLGGIR